MPFKPGISGNPSGLPAGAVIPAAPVDIPKDRTTKADNLRTDSYVVAKRIGQHIISDLERRGKKDWNAIRNKVWSWGVATDKVLQGAQDQPTTVNQVNLLFGAVAPALQRAILGKAFEVMQGKAVDNSIPALQIPQDVAYTQVEQQSAQVQSQGNQHDSHDG